MTRLRQLMPCLLFAAFMVSAVACVPVSHGDSLPLLLVCTTVCWTSFVALAVLVATHTRGAPRPGSRAGVGATGARGRSVAAVDAPGAGIAFELSTRAQA